MRRAGRRNAVLLLLSIAAAILSCVAGNKFAFKLRPKEALRNVKEHKAAALTKLCVPLFGCGGKSIVETSAEVSSSSPTSRNSAPSSTNPQSSTSAAAADNYNECEREAQQQQQQQRSSSSRNSAPSSTNPQSSTSAADDDNYNECEREAQQQQQRSSSNVAERRRPANDDENAAELAAAAALRHSKLLNLLQDAETRQRWRRNAFEKAVSAKQEAAAGIDALMTQLEEAAAQPETFSEEILSRFRFLMDKFDVLFSELADEFNADSPNGDCSSGEDVDAEKDEFHAIVSSLKSLIHQFDHEFAALAAEFNADWPRSNWKTIEAFEAGMDQFNAICSEFFDHQVQVANDFVQWLSTANNRFTFLLLKLKSATVTVEMCSCHPFTVSKADTFISSLNRRMLRVQDALSDDNINCFTSSSSAAAAAASDAAGAGAGGSADSSEDQADDTFLQADYLQENTSEAAFQALKDTNVFGFLREAETTQILRQKAYEKALRAIKDTDTAIQGLMQQLIASESETLADVSISSLTLVIDKFDQVFSELADELNAAWPRCNWKSIAAFPTLCGKFNGIVNEFFHQQVQAAKDITQWLSTANKDFKFRNLRLKRAILRVQMCTCRRFPITEVNRFINKMQEAKHFVNVHFLKTAAAAASPPSNQNQ